MENEYDDAWAFVEFQKAVAEMDINMLRQSEGVVNFEERFYLNVIDDFIETGRFHKEKTGDPIYDYMMSIMSDPLLQAQVLSDEVTALIFKDNMIRFVDSCLNRKRFHINRKKNEMKQIGETLDWSFRKREDGWEPIISKLEQTYSEFGFHSVKYRKQFEKGDTDNDELWKSIYDDYLQALNEYLRKQQNEMVRKEKEHVRKKLDNQLSSIPKYLQGNNVNKDDFAQAWGMMGGEWNEYDFERFLHFVELQRDHPQINELADRMGRVPCPKGDKLIRVGTGRNYAFPHSTKSDIQGVTIGNSLDSLLPTELVQVADDDFNELFLLKYTTSKLQSFMHKSQQFNPNRQLERKRARTKGPMIACIDTSGSMSGLPENIARSLLMKLVSIAEREFRPLYVVAFSVSANPIDTKKDKNRLLDFFSKSSTGDTNATKMIQHTLDLLENNATYMCGDVVIIGDFRMDLVSNSLLDRISQHRKCGTFFYGLQIGSVPENKWSDFLDKIYFVEFSMFRK